MVAPIRALLDEPLEREILERILDLDQVGRREGRGQKPIFWSPVCTYDFEDQTGFVTWMNLIVALPKHCDPVSLLDVAGSGFTGDDGKRVFRLSLFICLQNQLLQPANVVATPQSPNPATSRSSTPWSTTPWTWRSPCPPGMPAACPRPALRSTGDAAFPTGSWS